MQVSTLSLGNMYTVVRRKFSQKTHIEKINHGIPLLCEDKKGGVLQLFGNINNNECDCHHFQHDDLCYINIDEIKYVITLLMPLPQYLTEANKGTFYRYLSEGISITLRKYISGTDGPAIRYVSFEEICHDIDTRLHKYEVKDMYTETHSIIDDLYITISK